MTTELDILEKIYALLHSENFVQSKADFSSRLLGKSPSYLTSMRARQRRVPTDVVFLLGEVVIGEMRKAPAGSSVAIALRRAMIDINAYLADQTICPTLKAIMTEQKKASARPQPRKKTFAESLKGIFAVF